MKTPRQRLNMEHGLKSQPTKTLRQQAYEVCAFAFSHEFVEATNLPRAVHDTMARAFLEGWHRDSIPARILIRFQKVMDSKGYVTDDEPGIEP